MTCVRLVKKAAGRAGVALWRVGFVVPLVKWACCCCCRSRICAMDEVGLVEVAALGTGGGTVWN